MVLCFDAQCNHQSMRNDCKMFRFPKDPIELQKWNILKERRKDRSPNEFDRVCSCHFVGGKKENGPTIFESNRSTSFDIRLPSKTDPKRRKQMQTSSESTASVMECQPLAGQQKTTSLRREIRPAALKINCETAMHSKAQSADTPSMKTQNVSPVSSASTESGWEKGSDDEMPKVETTNGSEKMTLLDKHFTDVAFETLLKFQERGFLCDAVLVARCGGEVKAHAVVLASVSPIFLAALQMSITGPYRFSFPEIELDILQIAIYFIYTGRLHLPIVYSQMDKLSILLYGLAQLGLDLQKLHGSEMTFFRNSKLPVEPKPSECLISNLEHDYHETNTQERSLERAPDVINVCINKTDPAVHSSNNISIIDLPPSNGPHILPASSVSSDRTVKNISSSGMTRRAAISIPTPVNSFVIDSSSDSDGVVEIQQGLLKTGPDKDIGQILVPDSNNSNTLNIVGENETVGDRPQNCFQFIDLSTEESSAVALRKECEGAKYICEFCEEPTKKEFRDEYELSVHKIKFHWDQCIRCPFCSRRFGSDSCLRGHLRCHVRMSPRKRNKNHLCDECGQHFESVTRLKDHKFKHAGVKPYECKECDKRFTMRYQLVRHQQLHIDDHPFLCDFCGKRFVRNSTLVMHLNLHHGNQQDLECALCNCRLKSKDEMEKHALEVHQLCQRNELNKVIKKPESLLCDLCGKNFFSALSLKHHIRGHNKKPAQCETCGKKFSSFYGLQLHTKLHTGERPFICQICQKGFIQKTSLIAHMVTHSGIKPFSCVACSKTFTNKCQLRKHTLMHTGDKPYKCGICNKQFAYKSKLTLHNRIHISDTP